MMIFYAILAGFLSLAYLIIMSRYWIYWERLPQWELPAAYIAQTTVSIIIPARNEAEHIVATLQAIQQQNYPQNLLEVIVIDDHSEDETATLVRSFEGLSIQLLSLADHVGATQNNSYKKYAIELALQRAKGALIVTTDADCVMGKDWLNYLVAYHQKTGAKLLAAPVNFFQEKSTMARFQSLDFIGMMGITGAGIYGGFGNLCNGANLAYEREAFFAVDGFTGIDNLASGDDMLLMQKIRKQFPEQIAFVKHPAATVYTTAKEDWRSFIQQRIRWASKSSVYTAWEVQLILVLVFLYCVNILVGLLCWPFFAGMVWWLGAQLLIKISIDYFYLQRMSHYFGRSDLMQSFLSSQFMHIAYIVGIGLLANLVKKYEWKGRKIK
ncbi:MAG: glycosyltransferase [Saprospiraceae bacterium]